MTEFFHSAIFLAPWILLPVFVGIIILAFGKKLPRQGDWLAGLGLILLLAGIIAGGLSLRQPEQPELRKWFVGWIWPREEAGAITVGILEDFYGLCVAALGAVIAGVFLFGRQAIEKEPRADRIYASLMFSASGVALAWLSLTPWLVFVGLALTILGGFISFGARWDTQGDSQAASRFGWERSWGLILAIFGSCVLISARPSLVWEAVGAVPEGSGSFSDSLGAWLIVIGLYVQLQAFPFLGGLVAEGNGLSSIRLISCQIFPAWAAFALWIRMEPQLRAIGIFPVFGWVVLAFAAISLASGFFQRQWFQGLAVWVSSGFCIAFAILAFAGPMSAQAMLLGFSLGAVALACMGSHLEVLAVKGTGGASQKKRAQWAKAVTLLAGAAGTGVIGFVSTGGVLEWLAHGWNDNYEAVYFGAALYLFSLLGWRQVCSIFSLKSATDANWLTVLSLVIFPLLALGVIWTGTITGGALPAGTDLVMPSVFTVFFGDAPSKTLDSSTFFSVSWIYWGALAAAILVAVWMSTRQKDIFERMSEAFPKFAGFLSGGYRIDDLFGGILRGVRWTGSLKLWNFTMPPSFGAGVRRGASAVVAADMWVLGRLETFLARWVDVPSKVLQLVQSGDVQWYVLFALGSGFALLIHFLII